MRRRNVTLELANLAVELWFVQHAMYFHRGPRWYAQVGKHFLKIAKQAEVVELWKTKLVEIQAFGPRIPLSLIFHRRQGRLASVAARVNVGVLLEALFAVRSCTLLDVAPKSMASLEFVAPRLLFFFFFDIITAWM